MSKYLLMGLLLILGLTACGEATTTPTASPHISEVLASRTSIISPVSANSTTSTPPVPAANPTTLANISLTGKQSMRLAQTGADLLIVLQITPGPDNNNPISVTLSNTSDNQPISNASEVSVQSNSTEMDMGQQRLKLEAVGLGIYQAPALHLTMYGKWKLDVLVKRPGKSELDLPFEFNVQQ